MPAARVTDHSSAVSDTAGDPVPPGPLLLRRHLSQLPLLAQPWLYRPLLKPIRFSDFREFDTIVAGIYLVTDESAHIRWLGQARREDELSGRLAAHWANPRKRAVFHTLRVLHLLDDTPARQVDNIEGGIADALGLRGAMGRRRWPTPRA